MTRVAFQIGLKRAVDVLVNQVKSLSTVWQMTSQSCQYFIGWIEVNISFEIYLMQLPYHSFVNTIAML